MGLVFDKVIKNEDKAHQLYSRSNLLIVSLAPKSFHHVPWFQVSILHIYIYIYIYIWYHDGYNYTCIYMTVTYHFFNERVHGVNPYHYSYLNRV